LEQFQSTGEEPWSSLMERQVEQLVVVTHPEPVQLEARPMEAVTTPDGSTALGYYHRGNILARGVVSNDALEAIEGLLEAPVSVALAATEDDEGNIEARICLVLPVDPDEEPKRRSDDDEEPNEPWRASVPEPPQIGGSWNENPDDVQPKLALLPIGNAVRGARDRHHPQDVAGDVREMLDNLLTGRGRDAVTKAIDDLLNSL
jgi:hypothetical protein